MELKETLDKLEHVGIYVVDRTTLITYYENPTARKYSLKDRIGEPCYRIHGNHSMCSSCPIRSKDHISIVNRSDHGMIFEVCSAEVDWEGQPAYLISVVKQTALPYRSEDEKSVARMSRTLQKSVNVYTEINMDTMQYRQFNLKEAEQYSVAEQGDYAEAFEYMCQNEIYFDDIKQVRSTLSPEALQKIASDSEGTTELTVRYRLKNASPMRMMESRMIFIRDELPHYTVSIVRDVTVESRLREQAEAMESILNHVSCGVAIYAIGDDDRISCKYMNDGLCAMAECSKETMIKAAQKDPLITIDPDYKEEVQEAIERAATGKDISVTFTTTTFAGNHPWIRLKLTGLINPDGTSSVYGTFLDVTAEIETQRVFREKFEAEKRHSQDDTSLLAYAVFNLRTHTTIEMERRKPFLLMEDTMSLEGFRNDIATTFVSKEKRDQFVRMFDTESLLRQHEKGIDEQSIEYRRILPDGKIIWVKSSFHLIADSSGLDIMLFYYCNDINISKNLELITTHMANEDYDMLGCINFADDSAIMLYGNNSSRRLHGNMGIQRQEKYSEALEWFVNHAVIPEEREQYRTHVLVDKIRSILSKQESYEFSLHVLGKDDKILTKKIRYSRYNSKSDVCFFSQTDITEVLAAEEARQENLRNALADAKQANEAKTLFLSRMSHDIRTPMNGILGMIELAKDHPNPPDTESCLEKMRLSCGFLLELINDILDLSKIESGKITLHQEAYPVNEFQDYLESVIRPMCTEKNIRLELIIDGTLDGKCPFVDKLRVNQIFFNIISNAVKFTPEKGSVTIHIWFDILDPSHIHLYGSVSDTGIGISREFQEHMFDSFTQEEQEILPQRQGSGLGLSIAKSMMDLMGGTIACQSELGKGSTFTIQAKVPLVDLPRRIMENKAVSSNQDDKILKGKRVLLTEDHPLNQEIARRLLERKDMIVSSAENGKNALEAFQSSAIGHYDLILMDIRMPIMDGLTASKMIRALDRSDAKTIPIIAMTANAFDEDVRACLGAGMNGHLAKPIIPDKLYKIIKKYLTDESKNIRS